MILIIAEKPQVASAIADAIGNSKKEKGYIQCNEFIITWCVGHLLDISFPAQKKSWEWNNLPLIDDGWTFEINEKTKEQYEIIVDLLKSAKTVIHAGDPDDEGQLIVDSILYKNGIIDLKGHSNKVVKRLLINDFNTEVIAKQLQVLKDNNDYLYLSLSAIARKLADMLFGFNMSRAYTIKNQELGNTNIISIGRVQTPMLALIVRRDEEVKNHVKSKYYEVKLNLNIDDRNILFKYQPIKDEVDDNKNIIDKHIAEQIVNRIKENINKSNVTLDLMVKEENEYPPLPYNLLDLQVDCAKYLKIKSDEVMNITQTLREKHRCITYNRSDCNYINEETYKESSQIIHTLQNIQNESLNSYIDNMDIGIKSKAFNSDKVTAHTAIIPVVNNKINFSSFTKEEKAIYLMIAKRFLLQFYPPAEYTVYNLTIKAGNDELKHTTRILNKSGWKGIDNINEDNNNIKMDKSLFDNLIINQNNTDIKIYEMETKPKKLYKMDTFLNDLKRVSIYCNNEEIKKILKEKDKGKEGENGGIGTPATRSEIIKKLYNQGYIKDEQNNVISTELGRQLINSLSDMITYPDITAIWHLDLKEIKKYDNIQNFTDKVIKFSSDEIDKLKSKELILDVNAERCSNCNSILKKLKNKQGSNFWLCSNKECNQIYQDKNGKPDLFKQVDCPVCNEGKLNKNSGQYGVYWKCNKCLKTFKDDNGKPIEKEQLSPSLKYKCMECNNPLIRRVGKYGYFWACSAYPKCKQIYKDINGEPQYSSSEVKSENN